MSLVTILSGFEINNFARQPGKPVCYNFVAMFNLFRLWLGAMVRVFRTRRSLMLENLALRQQLAVLKRKQPRPRLGTLDKLFWVVARRLWPQWKEALVLVLPDTVVRWHRSGFKLYWAMLCKTRKRVGGGRRIFKEARALIFRMVTENPTWGAPRIHGELLMLGFDVSETTISRWMRRAPRNPEPAHRWLAFLRNHREAIVAMDFFTVPTLTFNLLYCFFIISHDRRRILHLKCHSASDQQLDCPATARSISLSVHAQVPHPGSRRKVWTGSPGCDSIHEDGLRANLHPEPLAKWSRGALGGQLPARVARSDHPAERATSQATSLRVHLLLP